MNCISGAEEVQLRRYPVDIIRGVVARSGGAGSYTARPCRAAVTPCGTTPWWTPRARKRERERERKKTKEKKSFETSRRVGRTGVISTTSSGCARCLLARAVFARVPVYVMHTYVRDTCIPCRREKGSRLNCRALLTAPGNRSRRSPRPLRRVSISVAETKRAFNRVRTGLCRQSKKNIKFYAFLAIINVQYYIN